jgi:transmembrane sensor
MNPAMPNSSNGPQLSSLKQQAIDWLVRLRSDDLSEEETFAFADWLSQDYSHSQAFAAAEDLFNDMEFAEKHASVVTDLRHQLAADKPRKSVSSEPNNKCSLTTNTYSSWIGYSLALAAAWLFAAVLIIPSQSHQLQDYLSDFHTNTGELREIQLVDGSHMLLNTNSAVSVEFNESIRQITLHHGQARFNVAKDAQRPFEVVSDGLTVRALGTVFEVYKDDSSEMSIIVQEHAVKAYLQPETQITDDQHLTSVKIQEGQQLRYRSGGWLQKPDDIDLNQTTAWQQHRLFINDRPLSELIAELERYRVGRIFLSDEKLKNLRVTGVFSLDNPDDVIKSVSKVLTLNETRLGPWWVLLHR